MTSLCQELNSIINCAICENRLKNPVRLVECMHAYCRDCLDRDCVGKKNYKCKVCGTSVNPLRLESESRVDGSLEVIVARIMNEPISPNNIMDRLGVSEAELKTWICVKLVLCKGECHCSTFPSHKYFTLSPQTPLSVLIKLVRQKAEIDCSVQLILRVKNTASGMEFKVQERFLFSRLAEKAGHRHGVLELYIDLISLPPPPPPPPAKRVSQTNDTLIKRTFPPKPPEPVPIRPRPAPNIANTSIRANHTTLNQSVPNLSDLNRSAEMNILAHMLTRPGIQAVLLHPHHTHLLAAQNRAMNTGPIDPNTYRLLQQQENRFANHHRQPYINNVPRTPSIFPHFNTVNSIQQVSNSSSVYAHQPRNTQNATKYQPILPRPVWVHDSAPESTEGTGRPQSPRSNRYRSSVMKPQLMIPRDGATAEDVNVGNDYPSSSVLRLPLKNCKLERDLVNKTVKAVLDDLLTNLNVSHL